MHDRKENPKEDHLQGDPAMTVAEVCHELHISPNRARRLFANEPGVLKLPFGDAAVVKGKGRGKIKAQQKIMLRIPRSVYERVRQRLLQGSSRPPNFAAPGGQLGSSVA